MGFCICVTAVRKPLANMFHIFLKNISMSIPHSCKYLWLRKVKCWVFVVHLFWTINVRPVWLDRIISLVKNMYFIMFYVKSKWFHIVSSVMSLGKVEKQSNAILSWCLFYSHNSPALFFPPALYFTQRELHLLYYFKKLVTLQMKFSKFTYNVQSYLIRN